MRICFLSKFPPIEGGESSKAYWLIKGLSDRGHKLSVITNSWAVEKTYREKFYNIDIDYLKLKNVELYNVDPFVKEVFIPYFNPFTEKIASLAIEAINNNDLDIIDSWYILPYGISGFLAKTITQRPQLLRHAGSDITRLFNSREMNTLFKSLFVNVDGIITYPKNKDFFLNLGITEEKILLNKVSVNTSFFHPNILKYDLSNHTTIDYEKLPIITYIGKISKYKGVNFLIQALSKIKHNFIFLLVSQNGGIEDIKKTISTSGLINKTIFLDFVPPWKIPSILKLSTCIVFPEKDFPIKIHSPTLPREAMCVGRCTILSDELFTKRTYRELENFKGTIVINPIEIQNFSLALEKIIANPEHAEEIGNNAYEIAKKYEKFDDYIQLTESFYRRYLNDHET